MNGKQEEVIAGDVAAPESGQVPRRGRRFNHSQEGVKSFGKNTAVRVSSKELGEARPNGLPTLLTVPEVAEALRTSAPSVYNMIHRGQIPGIVRLGRKVLFDQDVLRNWILERTGK